jgi:hypothetical protein
MFGMTRLCGASLLALLALLPAGCGGGGGSPVVAGEPIDYRELVRSASTSAEATSGRFAFGMTMTLPIADEPFSFSGEGAFDAASERASFAVDMSSFAKLLGGLFAGLAGPNAADAPDFDDPEGWKIEVVQDGDVGYLRFPALDGQLPDGKSWIRADGDETSVGGFDFDQLGQFTSSDPRELLESLRAVGSDIETVGSERLRGVETTHYRAVIDPADLAKVAAKEQPRSESLVDSITSQSGLGEVPVDVWIDAQGLVRKLSMQFSATDPGTSQSSEVSLAFELWDYGERVEIALPPASQVAEASDIR